MKTLATTELFFFSRIFRRLRKIAKKGYYLRMSVSPHGTTRLPIEGFLLNLIFNDLSIICVENSSFIKIGQE